MVQKVPMREEIVVYSLDDHMGFVMLVILSKTKMVEVGTKEPPLLDKVLFGMARWVRLMRICHLDEVH